ncbi:hypothetical protein F4777DRAFT_526649 [Nemania sp. FL0916]|nr:hypothetical protein F4777DRAFT_526649 [Nemania sp. FL0916]
MEDKPASGPVPGRQKMNYACEACRAAKTKCQSTSQPGICKRCSEFKRECVFRTGPRTRRPKASLRATGDSVTTVLPPPPGPGKTFSIDFEMPAAEDPSDGLEMLRQQHEQYLEDLVPDHEEDEDEQQHVIQDSIAINSNNNNNNKTFSFNDMSTSSSLPGMVSKPKSKPIVDLAIKPQFNLDSATTLLASFRDMLPHQPCLVLPEDADVRSLARNSPFVLLAILAVTSCSRSLQGHSLYDEEFRKVFGLKFVAGGERSLELLQGVLIYCSWYPFHLRPRNKQAIQYMRMGVDIVHDLELEREADLSSRNLDNIRALLCCYYGISALASIWGKTTSALRYSPQISRCADVLEQSSGLEQDHHLVWLVRLQYVFEQLIEADKVFYGGPRDHQSEMHRNLIAVGLEAQFRDFRERMPARYASTTSIRLEILMIETFILAPAIFRFPRKQSTNSTKHSPTSSIETVAPERLLQAAHRVRAVFDHVANLPARELAGLSGADYGRFIVAVTFAYRLSFPVLGICRDYDVARGRQVLDFGAVLRRLTTTGTVTTPPDHNPNPDRDRAKDVGGGGGGGGGTGIGKRSDAVSALRVVLRSVETKFAEKSAAFEAMAARELGARDLLSTCPMLNGSLDPYISLWAGQQQQGTATTSSSAPSMTNGSGMMTDVLASDFGGGDSTTSFAASMPMWQGGAGGGIEGGFGFGSPEDKRLMYHDLWTTMTMDWPADIGEVNMEDIGNTGYNDMLDQV